MSGSSSDWFPTPPPKPLQAPSTAKVIFGTLVVALGVAGAGVALSVNHSGHKAKQLVGKPVAAQRTGAAEESPRQAFADCMKNMGAGSGPRRGRFGGGGPSQSFRKAYGVCRSLLQSGNFSPLTPERTGTVAAPAA